MRESWGSTKPKGTMKVKGILSVALGRISAFGPSALLARLVFSQVRRSKSVHVGTRKMVNYA